LLENYRYQKKRQDGAVRSIEYWEDELLQVAGTIFAKFDEDYSGLPEFVEKFKTIAVNMCLGLASKYENNKTTKENYNQTLKKFYDFYVKNKNIESITNYINLVRGLEEAPESKNASEPTSEESGNSTDLINALKENLTAMLTESINLSTNGSQFGVGKQPDMFEGFVKKHNELINASGLKKAWDEGFLAKLGRLWQKIIATIKKLIVNYVNPDYSGERDSTEKRSPLGSSSPYSFWKSKKLSNVEKVLKKVENSFSNLSVLGMG